MKKVIFFSNIFYESPIQIGDHQLARQFARHGWQVAFISMPVTPFHLLGKERALIRQRFKNYSAGGARYSLGAGEIWSYVPGALLTPRNSPGLDRPGFYRNWLRWAAPGLRTALRRAGFAEADLLYFREPLYASFVDQVAAGKTVYRIADRDSGFSQYNPGLAANEQSLARRVDLTVYTARELQTYVDQLQPRRSLYLPNGVDYEFFQTADPTPPTELSAVRQPIVIYVGTLEKWFNSALLNFLVRALPEVTFVIIGPGQAQAAHLEPRPNLLYLGPRPHSEIPAYLHSARAGIIPFDLQHDEAFIDAISPIKLYEYMACGLPVVSTRWKELENIASPAILCDQPEEFLTALKTVLSQPADGPYYRNFARQNDWESRYLQLTAALGLEPDAPLA